VPGFEAPVTSTGVPTGRLPVEQPSVSEASPDVEVSSEPAPAPAAGSETVAQADNTAGATETTNAPHEAAPAVAVEPPTVSEASSDLEVPSEPAPAVGSETVAHVDNTVNATETADAPHRVEAAAVEQPALSEASQALEMPLEPAPAPAVGSETIARADNTASATEMTNAPQGVEAAAVEQAALSEAFPALEVRSGQPATPAMAADEESQAAIEHEWSPLLEKGLIPRNPAGSNGPNSFG